MGNTEEVKAAEADGESSKKKAKTTLTTRVLRRIPTTDEFKIFYRDEITSEVSTYLSWINAIPSEDVPQYNRDASVDMAIYHLTRLASVEIWWNRVWRVLTRYFIIQFIAPVFGQWAKILDSKQPHLSHIAYWFYMALSVVLWVMAAMAASWVLKLVALSKPRSIATVSVCVDIFFLGLALYVKYWVQHAVLITPLLAADLTSGLGGAMMSFFYDLLWTIEATVATYLFLWWRNIRFPDAVIVADHINILAALNVHPEQWGTLRTKKRILGNIEEIASCFQYFIPRALGIRNKEQRQTAAIAYQEISNSFRDLTSWITTPRLDSRIALKKRIQTSLFQVLSGDWNGLERVASTATETKPGRGKRFLEVLRALLSAALAPAALFVFRRVYPHVSIPTPVTAAVFAWVAIILLFVLDPEIRVKIETLKEASQIVASTGKKE